MSDLVFLFTRSIKNGILRMLKKPASLIGYLLLMALFGFNIFNTAENIQIQESYTTGETLYLATVLLLTYFSVLQPIYNGTKRFSLRYLPADGVYLMSAPVKPIKVLWYAQIKQSFTMILVSFFMIIQIPVLIDMVGLSARGVVIFLVSFFTMSLLPNVLSLFTFTLGLRYEISKRIAKILTIGIGAIGIIIVASNLYLADGTLLERLHNCLISEVWVFVPIIGWIYYLFVSSTLGYLGFLAIMCIVVNIVVIVLSFVMISRFTDEGFYEEALNTANTIETVRQGMKDGKSQMEATMSTKKVKVKSIKSVFKKEGVFALFDKQILLTRKKGISFLDIRSLFIIVMIVASMYLSSTVDGMKDFGIFITFGVVSYGLFFMQLMNSASDDLDRHYVYLFPYNAFEKLLALSLWGYIKISIDGIIGFTIASFLTNYNFFECLLGGVFIGLIGYGFNMVSILANIVFGKTGTLVLRMMMRIFIDIFMVAFVVVLLVLIIGGDIETKLYLGLLSGIGIMCIIDAILMIPASLIVKKPEFNQ